MQASKKCFIATTTTCKYPLQVVALKRLAARLYSGDAFDPTKKSKPQQENSTTNNTKSTTTDDNNNNNNNTEKQDYKKWLQSKPILGALSEKINKQREQLKYELETTPLTQIRELRQHHDKLFVATKDFVLPAQTMYFPLQEAILSDAKNLKDEVVDLKWVMNRHKATLVALSFVAGASVCKWYCFVMCIRTTTWHGLNPLPRNLIPHRNSSNQWHLLTCPFPKVCKSIIVIVLLQGLAYRLLKNVITKNVKQQTPEAYHANTIALYCSDASAWKQKLKITNFKTNYIYLCDQAARIRWIATGVPLPEEVQTLNKLTRQLCASQ